MNPLQITLEALAIGIIGGAVVALWHRLRRG